MAIVKSRMWAFNCNNVPYLGCDFDLVPTIGHSLTVDSNLQESCSHQILKDKQIFKFEIVGLFTHGTQCTFLNVISNMKGFLYITCVLTSQSKILMYGGVHILNLIPGRFLNQIICYIYKCTYTG